MVSIGWCWLFIFSMLALIRVDARTPLGMGMDMEPVAEAKSEGQSKGNEGSNDEATVRDSSLEQQSGAFAEAEPEKEEEELLGDDEEEVVEVQHVDLVNQTKHIGDIIQLWDESEIDGNMRNALRSSSNQRWTTLRDTDGKYVIPYNISGQFTSEQRQIIQRAINVIDSNTCIRFRPRRSEADYVDIQNRKDEGCYTTVGRLRGRQVLMLETGWRKSCGRGCLLSFPGCVDHGTVVHELMHKIGLWHEQMRYDRDNYITIHWRNITSGFESQFNKIGQDDYRSIMHYGKDSGAKKRNLLTMETKDKRFQDVIGNATDASPQDYQKICSIYQCNRCMGRPFTPLRSLVQPSQQQTFSEDSQQQENSSETVSNETDASVCEPLSADCDRGIQPGHSLYGLYCCPKCDECEPRAFCSDIDRHSQKLLHETFCCGRCI